VATYKDIQQATGLSLATISKYYNGLRVRDENRQAIEDAAKALDYRVNVMARNLRNGRTKTIGVALPSLANDFVTSIVAAVARELHADGIGVLVSSQEGTNGEPADAVEFLVDRMVDAIIAVPDDDLRPGLASAIARGLPVVCVDWPTAGLDADSVVLDNAGAGRMVAHHLIDHGHRSIGMIGGDDIVPVVQRGEGFRELLSLRGIDVEPEMMRTGPSTVESAYHAMMQLLQSVSRPTAIFAANYELTVGALIALNESGLRLGSDMSFVGFDSTELARVLQPRLSVVSQPIGQMGAETARLVRARLQPDDGSATRQQVVLSGELQVGGSVASRHG
jgi:DNA-binding LacI/PurR family transcriptional regulator